MTWCSCYEHDMSSVINSTLIFMNDFCQDKCKMKSLKKELKVKMALYNINITNHNINIVPFSFHSWLFPVSCLCNFSARVHWAISQMSRVVFKSLGLILIFLIIGFDHIVIYVDIKKYWFNSWAQTWRSLRKSGV